ncbi:MAG: translation initiation factor IF-2 N-terminal domain-containing protein, partial [Lachnospiraceae bacterium]|nr:translation initiation factor IF-2 N-terminal domain-containing protein [Lachnospiraceae bacterium]
MAKMKVYELAQEIGVKSAEVLALLKNKGIEVKSHMSVLEDGQVEDVRKSMKAPAKSEEAPKTTEKSEPAKAAASGETKASAKTGEGVVKKKKSIIFVSNPHNSKMPGGAQIPRKPVRSEKKAAPQPKPENAETKKAVLPARTESAETIKPAAAVKEEPVAEKPLQKAAETVKAVEVKAELPKNEESGKADVAVKVAEPVKATAVKAEEQRPLSKSDSRDNNRNDGQRRNNNNGNNRG